MLLRTADITLAHRAEILRLHRAGASKAAIAQRVGCSWSAVRATTKLDDFTPREEVVATVKGARFEPTPVRPTAPADPELALALRQWTTVRIGNLAHVLRTSEETTLARCHGARVPVARLAGELWVTGRAPRPRDLGNANEKLLQRRAS